MDWYNAPNADVLVALLQRWIQICEIWDSKDNVRKRPFSNKICPSHPFEANWVKCKGKKNISIKQIFRLKIWGKGISQGLWKCKFKHCGNKKSRQMRLSSCLDLFFWRSFFNYLSLFALIHLISGRYTRWYFLNIYHYHHA